MAANLGADALLLVDRVGDVVGVQFSGEDEVALFIPGSGDVLLCTASQWRSLKDMPVARLIGLLNVPVPNASLENYVSGADLESTLLSLGACLAISHVSPAGFALAMRP
ncbi:MAG: hypothetical protein GZ093_05860 [Rhodoferax sp.]|uniref:hypothetical protein n=1 Tax=Rhodoferax sp. TaxID=50421 RepID=UPI0013FF7686|nr:hypothetical protein [Rhodoferax sp.]NDP38263.1 hypothetical protein [Rhodoferax sp.]